MTIPTTTVRLDEAPGLTGWTAEARPGTIADPRPILAVADAAGVIQAAERIDGLEDAEREEIWEEVGSDSVRCFDILVDPSILDPILRRATGHPASAMPGAARRLIQAAESMWWHRLIDAEEATKATAPAPVTAETEDTAWDF